jgi:hypothetical protein
VTNTASPGKTPETQSVGVAVNAIPLRDEVLLRPQRYSIVQSHGTREVASLKSGQPNTDVLASGIVPVLA